MDDHAETYQVGGVHVGKEKYGEGGEKDWQGEGPRKVGWGGLGTGVSMGGVALAWLDGWV